jgi:hypothetical protein
MPHFPAPAARFQVSVTGGQVTVSGSGLVVADGTILLE